MSQNLCFSYSQHYLPLCSLSLLFFCLSLSIYLYAHSLSLSFSLSKHAQLDIHQSTEEQLQQRALGFQQSIRALNDAFKTTAAAQKDVATKVLPSQQQQ